MIIDFVGDHSAKSLLFCHSLGTNGAIFENICFKIIYFFFTRNFCVVIKHFYI